MSCSISIVQNNGINGVNLLMRHVFFKRMFVDRTINSRANITKSMETLITCTNVNISLFFYLNVNKSRCSSRMDNNLLFSMYNINVLSNEKSFFFNVVGVLSKTWKVQTKTYRRVACVLDSVNQSLWTSKQVTYIKNNKKIRILQMRHVFNIACFNLHTNIARFCDLLTNHFSANEQSPRLSERAVTVHSTLTTVSRHRLKCRQLLKQY